MKGEVYSVNGQEVRSEMEEEYIKLDKETTQLIIMICLKDGTESAHLALNRIAALM